ncbi:MAG: tol-pal system protein YbgF [Deltaproteobacteria bacterium]|jgi:tol-pal system protein YbgF|nr:tol-pal system protein YbgF [Deltaproteobacteria bacterium]
MLQGLKIFCQRSNWADLRFSVKPYLYNMKTTRYGLPIIFLSLFFVSCNSMNYKKSPESNIENNSNSIKISSLESELVDVKNDQADIKLQLKNSNTTIENLEDQIMVIEEKTAHLKYSKNNNTKHISSSDLYKKARNLLIEENYITAADLFTDFIKKFPENTLAGNAAYWLGECYYSMNRYKKAITIFKDLAAQYPKSGKVPGALLKTGYAYLSLDDSNRAYYYLKQVLRKYPFSPAAEKAEEKLKSFE